MYTFCDLTFCVHMICTKCTRFVYITTFGKGDSGHQKSNLKHCRLKNTCTQTVYIYNVHIL